MSKGGGSTTSPGQLPSETKCPDPPDNLFPLPLCAAFRTASDSRHRSKIPGRFSIKQLVPSRSSPAPTGRDSYSLGRSAAQAQDPERPTHIQSSPLSPRGRGAGGEGAFARLDRAEGRFLRAFLGETSCPVPCPVPVLVQSPADSTERF